MKPKKTAPKSNFWEAITDLATGDLRVDISGKKPKLVLYKPSDDDSPKAKKKP